MSKQKITVREFVWEFLRKWAALMSGAFSVPFVALAVFAESSYGKIIWGLMAVASLLFSHFLNWRAQNNHIKELEERLSPKIRLFLHPDPFEQTTGIEFAKGESGQSLPYVQVSAEPTTDAAIDDPVANITRIEHRADNSSSFSEVMGETQIAGWSRQPQNVRLSKGKPIRFNICWYNENGLYDASPMPSYKLVQAYAKIGKTGEYRYRVHVDGRDVVRSEAYVYIKWRARGHPIITLELIADSR